MTKSYADGEVTIMAWRNRDRRAPRSLILREKDPTIYRNTVTAEVYAAQRPEPIIVPSTASSIEYHETYDGQKDRIKSTIVYPVLSDNNVLLGTLVVHCDKDRFFSNDDQLFWRSLLEIYAKRIAHQKLCLDVCYDLNLGDWIAAVDRNAIFDLAQNVAQDDS
jgi:GAF domain-containing protein